MIVDDGFGDGSVMAWTSICLGSSRDVYILRLGSIIRLRYRVGVMESIVRSFAALIGDGFISLVDND